MRPEMLCVFSLPKNCRPAARILLVMTVLAWGGCGSEAAPAVDEDAAVCSSGWKSLLTWDNPFRNITGVGLHGGLLYVATKDLYRLPAMGGAIEKVAALGGPVSTFRLNEDGGATIVKGNGDGDSIGQDSKDVLSLAPGGGEIKLLLTLPRPQPVDDDQYYYQGPILLDRDAVFAIRNKQMHTEVVRVDLATREETPLFQAERDHEGASFYSVMRAARNSTDWIVASGLGSPGENAWAISKTGRPHMRLTVWERVSVLGVDAAGNVLWWDYTEPRSRFAASNAGEVKRSPLKHLPPDGFEAKKAWPLADGSWLVAGTGAFTDGGHLTINRLTPDGILTRIACDPASHRVATEAHIATEGVYLKVHNNFEEIVYVPWN